jgi:antitoxin (DNA-binding transcriptional repressor) of toxin-antitoxin stability system
MATREVTVNVTEFKAKCLEHLRKLESGRVRKVTVTRRGKPVAVIERAAAGEMPVKDVYGFMRDVMRLSPDYDPFEQVVEEPSDPFFDTASDGDAAA